MSGGPGGKGLKERLRGKGPAGGPETLAEAARSKWDEFRRLQDSIHSEADWNALVADVRAADRAGFGRQALLRHTRFGHPEGHTQPLGRYGIIKDFIRRFQFNTSTGKVARRARRLSSVHSKMASATSRAHAAS